MSLFSPFSCLLGRHEPVRDRVKWNGQKYVGVCCHCGTSIIRMAHKHWRTCEHVTEEAQYSRL